MDDYLSAGTDVKSVDGNIQTPADIRKKLTKNRKIILDAFDREFVTALSVMQDYIGSHYNRMIATLLIKYIYRLLLKGKVRKQLKKEVDFVLKLIIKEVKNYSTYDDIVKNLDTIFGKYKNKYAKLEVSHKYLRCDHPKYAEVLDIIMADFRARILNLAKMMYADGNDYASIVKSAFGTRENTMTVIEEHLINYDKIIDILENTSDIFRIPIYRPESWAGDIQVLRKAYELALDIFRERVEAIFSDEQ